MSALRASSHGRRIAWYTEFLVVRKITCTRAAAGDSKSRVCCRLSRRRCCVCPVAGRRETRARARPLCRVRPQLSLTRRKRVTRTHVVVEADADEKRAATRTIWFRNDDSGEERANETRGPRSHNSPITQSVTSHVAAARRQNKSASLPRYRARGTEKKPRGSRARARGAALRVKSLTGGQRPRPTETSARTFQRRTVAVSEVTANLYEPGTPSLFGQKIGRTRSETGRDDDAHARPATVARPANSETTARQDRSRQTLSKGHPDCQAEKGDHLGSRNRTPRRPIGNRWCPVWFTQLKRGN